MLRWKSYPYCAGYFKAFQEMPWPYKALDYGSVLMPLSMTSAAVFKRGDSLMASIYWINAAIFLLLFASHLILRTRGRRALSLGIEPSPNPFLKQIAAFKLYAIVVAVTFGLVLFVTCLTLLKPTGGYGDWAGAAFLFAMLIMQTYIYAYSRFWPASAE